jgi:hypothetical protein
MTIHELLAAIAAADVTDDTEVYGPGGPLRCVHLEDGVLVLDETGSSLVRKLVRFGDTEVLWAEEEPTAA